MSDAEEKGGLPGFSQSGNDVTFRMIDATVAGVDRWSETQTWSSGGSVYADRYGAYIRPPQVHSSTSIHQRIWLRLSDGTETSVPAGNDVEVRPGHEVTVIIGENAPTKQASYVALVNHTTRYWHALSMPEATVRLTSSFLNLVGGSVGGAFQGGGLIGGLIGVALLSGLLASPILMVDKSGFMPIATIVFAVLLVSALLAVARWKTLANEFRAHRKQVCEMAFRDVTRTVEVEPEPA